MLRSAQSLQWAFADVKFLPTMIKVKSAQVFLPAFSFVSEVRS
jgi:hypothetical protein